jgi:beta-mannosidase
MDIYMSKPKDFPAFLYMSQVLQAEAMKMAIEAHRRSMPYCMGTLYWQMNDCWPVASWAGMDYYGNWKAMQYYAKRSFADTMLSFDKKDDEVVNIHAVTDLLEPLKGELRVSLYDFAGVLIKQETSHIALAGNSAAIVSSINEQEWLAGYEASSVVLYAELMQEGQLIDSKEYYFVKAKELKLSSAVIRITEVEGSDGTAFALETEVLAKQVWITAEREGMFNDNFFDLVPGVIKIVQFRLRESGEAMSKPVAAGKVQARSMIDFLAENK